METWNITIWYYSNYIWFYVAYKNDYNYNFGILLITVQQKKIDNLTAILFMQIRWSKTQNFAWEPGLSDSAYLNYAKKSGYQLLPKNASSIPNFPKSQIPKSQIQNPK